MTVGLRAPHGNANPHGFDIELWMWTQGVQASGCVRMGAGNVQPVLLERGHGGLRSSVREKRFATRCSHASRSARKPA